MSIGDALPRYDRFDLGGDGDVEEIETVRETEIVREMAMVKEMGERETEISEERWIYKA
jgi:hypothetical protein